MDTNASLRLSALNARKFYDKSVTDEMMTDKDTGIIFYNTPDTTNPLNPIVSRTLDKTISIDLMNRATSAINDISNTVDRLGGFDITVTNLLAITNDGYTIDGSAPFSLGKVTEVELDLTGVTGDIMLYIDACFARSAEKISNIDFAQSRIVVDATLSKDGTDVEPYATANGSPIYRGIDSVTYKLTLSAPTDSGVDNDEIFVYGIYLVELK